MKRTKSEEKLSSQVRKHIKTEHGKEEKERSFVDVPTISTGSTLLDLAISGEVTEFGGIPGGLLVEIAGPSGCGKTVLLCEIAGGIQRQGGEVYFNDPEARLNKRFAKLFGVHIDKKHYNRPATIPEVFKPVRARQPKPKGLIHGEIADSLAALTTEMEMEGTDKMGGRRAKEFSQELRKTCRILANNNILMVCSNQMRTNMDAGQYQEKDSATGGRAIEYYASLRLRCYKAQKIKKTISYRGQKITEVVGVDVQIKVDKSSVASPFKMAPLTIIFDYGIDDIRENLRYVKQMTRAKSYFVRKIKLGKDMEAAIREVENRNLTEKLRRQVVHIWHLVQDKFHQERKPKHEQR